MAGLTLPLFRNVRTITPPPPPSSRVSTSSLSSYRGQAGGHRVLIADNFVCVWGGIIQRILECGHEGGPACPRAPLFL